MIKMATRNRFVSTDWCFLSHKTLLIPICENVGVSMLQNINNILIIEIKTRKPFCIMKLWKSLLTCYTVLTAIWYMPGRVMSAMKFDASIKTTKISNIKSQVFLEGLVSQKLKLRSTVFLFTVLHIDAILSIQRKYIILYIHWEYIC